jgi:hypothetical protein
MAVTAVIFSYVYNTGYTVTYKGNGQALRPYKTRTKPVNSLRPQPNVLNLLR